MRAVIVAGGDADISQIRKELSTVEYELLIAADSGADYIIEAGYMPDVVVGDLDSIRSKKAALSSEIKTYPSEKDFTNTEAAFDYAFKSGADDILIYGACGRRLDHFMGNLSLLIKADKLGIGCMLKDTYNIIRLISGDTTISKAYAFGDYVSLIPIDDNVILSLEGFKYPLKNYHLTRDNALGVSNEITSDTAHIKLFSGRVLLIESSK